MIYDTDEYHYDDHLGTIDSLVYCIRMFSEFVQKFR